MSKIEELKYEFYEPTKTFKAWLLAIRPRTLSIGMIPIFIGSFLAYRDYSQMNWFLFLSALFSISSIQIGMNLINDALDFRKGEQLVNRLRLQRLNLLTPSQFLIGGYIAFGLAFFFGIPLLTVGWPFCFLLLISIGCGYCYTGGPYPFSYIGISDVVILIFYGWIATEAAYYLQTKQLSLECLLVGTQLGFLAIVPHAINNLRDHKADALVNKKTLAVRFGSTFARWEITFCSLIPFVLSFFWIFFNNIETAVFPILVLPLISRNLKAIWQVESHSLYSQLIGKSALCQCIFGLLIGIGILFHGLK